MGRLKEFLSEDSNQYGPGTDLMVSLMSILLVITFINGFLYKQATEKTNEDPFMVAKISFDTGNFQRRPYRAFTDEHAAREKIKEIARQYENVKGQYPYIFVIGHASDADVPNPEDPSPPAKWERNWNFAGERAALVSRFLQDELNLEDRDKLVVVSAGEFDQKDPNAPPESQVNALVRVVFGSKWNPQTMRATQAASDGH